jgi:hypothetical protein
MAIFTGKIRDAYYHSEDYKTIKIEVEDKDRGITFAHFIEVDPNDGEYQALIEEGYDEEKLVERTAEYKRSASRDIARLVNARATLISEQLLKEKYDRQVKIEAETMARKMLGPMVQQEYNIRLEREAHNLAKQKARVLAKDMVGPMVQEAYNTRLEKDSKEKAKKMAKELVGPLVQEAYDTRLEKDSKEKAKKMAKEMLGMNHLQEEKQRLEEEVQKKENSLTDLDQAVRFQTYRADNAIFDFIFQSNKDKEELFKMKLWALEMPEVKDSSRELKSKIRKSNSLVSIIKIVDSVINTEDE